jgi:mono/diheme cytochrome c family protein
MKLTALVPALWLAALAIPAVAADMAAPVDFTKDVLPIFQTSCVKCHGLDAAKPKKKAAAGFRLDDKDAALKGGRSGVAIVPGNSKDSLLFKLLSGKVTVDDKGKDREIDEMPKGKRGEKWKPLPDAQIAVIKQWIDQGANWAQ